MTGQRRVSEAELHAFVDGELAPAEAAEVEELLAKSPADHALVQEICALNDAIKARYPLDSDAAEPLGTRPRRSRFAIGRSRAGGRRMARAAAAMVLVLAGAVVGYLARGAQSPPTSAETAFAATAVAAHSVYVPEVRHPVEVKAGEAHLVRWLAKRVGADVRAPALSNLGWTLMGGRLLPDQDGLPAAQFMYEDAGGRRLTLYLRKETGLGNTAFRFYERDGFGAFYWIDRPLAYAIAGHLQREELMGLANAVYGQLEGQAGGQGEGQGGGQSPETPRQ